MVVYADRRSIRDPRNDALERVRRVFRWIVAGAATAVVVIVGVVAHEIPGRPPSTANSSNATPAVGSTSATAASASTAEGRSLSPPVTAPTPTRQAPTAVSGGTGW
jgi:hypothetical protein